MIFTDLDGTLIDHHSYQWAPAAPALERLRDLGVPVILASSKTASEISALRSELELPAFPAIVENGAGVLDAHAPPDGLTQEYDRVRDVLAGVQQTLRRHFTGFGDMTVDAVRRATGLDVAGAALAKQRAYSEPGLWDGTQDEKQQFLRLLADKGVHAQQGGRFLTLSFGATKADQVRALVAQFRPAITVSLGDAPNDIDMLQCTDLGVIVANPDKPPLAPLKGEDTGAIIRTKDAGPKGWNTAMLDLLARLNLEKD